MESGDGGWIHARGTQADEDAEYQTRSADGWPAVMAGPSAWPSTGTSAGTSTVAFAGTSTVAFAGKRWGRGGIPGFSGWMAAAVAMVAAVAGVVIGFFLVKGW